MKNELIKKIKFYFDLNVYESKVWFTLLTKNMATVSEIAEMSGVPRSRVYDIFESLEKKGFVVAKLGKPVRYIAIKPAVVIDRLKNNIIKEAEERIKVLNNVRETNEYKELESLHKKGIEPANVEDFTSAIKGRENINSYIKEMLSGAEKEIILVTNFENLKLRSHFFKPLFDKLKTSGVNVFVATTNPTSTEDNKEKTKKMFLELNKEIGVPVKKIKVNSKFCVVDNKKALIFLTPETDEEKEMAIWVESPFFVKAFTTFLSPIWYRK